MATPNVRRVPITLDKKRHIVLDLNALSAAEELTGRNYLKQASLNELSFLDVRALLYAGLLKEDPKITPEQVGALVHMGNIEPITEALVGAFTNAMPEAKPEAERPLDVPAVPRFEPETVPTS